MFWTNPRRHISGNVPVFRGKTSMEKDQKKLAGVYLKNIYLNYLFELRLFKKYRYN